MRGLRLHNLSDGPDGSGLHGSIRPIRHYNVSLAELCDHSNRSWRERRSRGNLSPIKRLSMSPQLTVRSFRQFMQDELIPTV